MSFIKFIDVTRSHSYGKAILVSVHLTKLFKSFHK